MPRMVLPHSHEFRGAYNVYFGSCALLTFGDMQNFWFGKRRLEDPVLIVSSTFLVYLSAFRAVSTLAFMQPRAFNAVDSIRFDFDIVVNAGEIANLLRSLRLNVLRKTTRLTILAALTAFFVMFWKSRAWSRSECLKILFGDSWSRGRSKDPTAAIEASLKLAKVRSESSVENFSLEWNGSAVHLSAGCWTHCSAYPCYLLA